MDLGKTTGQALAKTANRQALNAVQGTLKRAGLSRADLPGPLRKWLQTKDRFDENTAKAPEAQKAREARKWKERLVETGQVLEASSRAGLVSAPSVFDSELSTVERAADGSVRRTAVSRRKSTASSAASALNPVMALDQQGFKTSADTGFASQFVNSKVSTSWRDHEGSLPTSPHP